MPFPRPCILLKAQSIIILQSAGSWWPCCRGGGLCWLLLKQGMLVRDFSIPLLLCLSHFISPSKTYLKSLSHDFSTWPCYPPGPLQHNQTPVSLLSYLCFWGQWAYQADKEVSARVIILKYIPSCCRKLLRRVLFTLLPLPSNTSSRWWHSSPEVHLWERLCSPLRLFLLLLSAGKCAQSPK